MARPRTIADSALLDAALGLLGRQGPTALTFASLGDATGLAPATLVQRFGSKPQLLETTLVHAWDKLEAQTAEEDARCPVTPRGAIELLVKLSAVDSADSFADGLLLLREDYRNPVLRKRGDRWGKDIVRILGRRLSDDPKQQSRLGRAMATQWQGALLWWGFSRAGTVETFVAAELQAFLDMVSIKRK